MNNKPQSNQPDPAKAIVLKPHKRTRKRQQHDASSQTWQPHLSTAALDGWGVALRTLREQGHQYE